MLCELPAGRDAAYGGGAGLTIIGEALAQLARVDAPLAAKITDFRSIVAFRNILVHAYAQVDERIVWDIVQSKLPVLVREVAALMDAGNRP